MINLGCDMNNHFNTNDKICNGLPVFKKTRIPVAMIYNFLLHGTTIKELLISYPTINREALECMNQCTKCKEQFDIWLNDYIEAAEKADQEQYEIE